MRVNSGRNYGGNGDESDKCSSVAGWEVLNFGGFEGEFTFLGKVKYGYTVSEKFAVSFAVGWNIDWLWKGESDCSGCETEEVLYRRNHSNFLFLLLYRDLLATNTNRSPTEKLSSRILAELLVY